MVAGGHAWLLGGACVVVGGMRNCWGVHGCRGTWVVGGHV